MRLWTAQYRYSGPYRLDITVKGQDPAGKAFAPTWDLVMGYKRNKDDQAYIAGYHQLMLASYNNHRSIWEDILSRDQVVMVCFCKAFTFCHRYLMADYLQKLGAKYVGELSL